MMDVFVGYDPGEAAAFHVCVNSIIRHASRPVRITPLALNTLPYEEKHGDGSTQFAYTRFLVPYLSGYVGRSLFIDGDMLVKADIAELFDTFPLGAAVAVVKHPPYVPVSITKFRGAKQTMYRRKNWSSVMLFENSSSFCRALNPEYVSRETGVHLHQFAWVPDDRIADLPLTWNHLVGQYPHDDTAKLLHYTEGVPAFQAYQSCDHASEWFDELRLAMSVT